MSEKCWECRLKVLPLFRVSESRMFQFSSFGIGNWKCFPAQSCKFSFKSGESQRPEEPLVLLQDGREGFKLCFLKGCLAWTSCTPCQRRSRTSVGKTDTTTQLKESCPLCWAFMCNSFAPGHTQLGLGVWLQLLQ